MVDAGNGSTGSVRGRSFQLRDPISGRHRRLGSFASAVALAGASRIRRARCTGKREQPIGPRGPVTFATAASMTVNKPPPDNAPNGRPSASKLAPAGLVSVDDTIDEIAEAALREARDREARDKAKERVK